MVEAVVDAEKRARPDCANATTEEGPARRVLVEDITLLLAKVCDEIAVFWNDGARWRWGRSIDGDALYEADDCRLDRSIGRHFQARWDCQVRTSRGKAYTHIKVG